MDAYARKLRQKRLELVPDPFSQDFACGVFKPRKIIQVVVIELLIKRFEDRFDLGEVANPSGMRINLSFDIDCYAEGVPVQAPALVPGWDMRQPVGCLEHELFEQFQSFSLC
jgi:hypothetical protein